MPPTPDADLHHDIARDIGQQVERMILDAKRKNEEKVGKEIQKVKAKMDQISEKIMLVKERSNCFEAGNHGMLKSELQGSIEKLEEVWEREVGTLKHELWQTIQAHNHNADLLKHHKDAIDQVQNRMQERESAANPELEQMHTQLLQLDKVMQREQNKEQQMDQLMQRLTVVQQQISGWPGSALAGYPDMLPQAAAAPPQVAAVAAASKKAQRKASGKKAAKAHPPAGAASLQNAASLRAEAPEFVPTTSGWSES
jgi:uncharacterized protein YukE